MQAPALHGTRPWRAPVPATSATQPFVRLGRSQGPSPRGSGWATGGSPAVVRVRAVPSRRANQQRLGLANPVSTIPPPHPPPPNRAPVPPPPPSPPHWNASPPPTGTRSTPPPQPPTGTRSMACSAARRGRGTPPSPSRTRLPRGSRGHRRAVGGCGGRNTSDGGRPPSSQDVRWSPAHGHRIRTATGAQPHTP